MADPISIFSVIGGSAALVLQFAKAVNDLHTLAERYKRAEFKIQSLTSHLSTIQWAWQRIGTMLENWTHDDEIWQDDSTQLFMQVNRSLKGGSLVIAALEEDLKPFLEQPSDPATNPQRNLTFKRRVKIAWNDQTFKDHQERIRDQVNSMNLLINIMQMPEAVARRQALNVGLKVFRKSDESAFSIVPSRASIRPRDTESLLSFESRESLVYRELTIDSDLFTARVYKRNYRNALISDMLKKAKVLPDRTRDRFSQLSVHSGGQTQYNVSILGPSMNGPGSDLSNESVCFPRYSKTLDNRGWLEAAHIDERVQRNYIASIWLVGKFPSVKIQGPRLPAEWFNATSTPATESLSSNLFSLASEVRKINSHLLEWVLHEGQDLPQPWLDHCLMTACLYGSMEIVSLLMQNLRWRELILPQQDSLRLHYIDDNPIDLAFHHGHVDIVKTMLDYLHSTSKTVSLSSGQLLVRRAIIRNEWPLLDALLRLGVSTTYRYTYGDEQGARLIRIACQFGSKDCIDVFMKHVDTVDQSGQTARYQLTRMNKFLNVGYKMPAQYSNKEKTGETVNGGQSQTHDRMPDKVSDSTHEQAPPGFDRYGDHFLSLDTKTRAYPSEAPQRRSRWLVGGKDSVKVVEGPRITGYGVSTCFPHGAIDNGILDLNQAMGHCIFFTRLFTECNDFPKHWLRHCLFAACQEGWAYLADLIVTITAGSELVLVSDEVSRLYEYTDPCELAFHNGHHDIVKLVLLLPEYTVPEPFVRDLLQDALERDDADMLSSLLKHGVDLDFRLNDMMRTILAAHQNNTEKCTKLLVEREVAVAPTTQQHKSLYDLLKTKSIEFTSVSMP